jgi:hypothetical protein
MKFREKTQWKNNAKQKKIAIKRIMTKFDTKIKLNYIFREKSNEIKCSWMDLYKNKFIKKMIKK